MIVSLVISILTITALNVGTSTLFFDKDNSILEGMKSNNIDIMFFKKEITYHNSDDNVCSDTVLMNEDDKTDIEKKLDSSVDEIFTIDKSLYIDNINKKGWISEKEIKGYCVINESFLDKYNNYTIIGNLPSNSNEIVITDYHLLLFKLYGYKYNTVNFIIKKRKY